MDKDRKIQLQQDVIEQLSKENAELKKEIKQLKIEQDISKDSGMETLTDELREQIDTYRNFSDEIKKVRKTYIDKTEELIKLKNEYKKKMDNLIKSIKKGIK